MTGTSSESGAVDGARQQRLWKWWLAAIALFAFGLRVFPFFGPEGAWSLHVDYDEGVYFSSAAWWSEGVWPWRDFFFVHPPGHLVFLLITSVWTKGFLGLSGAFAVARWVAAIVGATTTVLVGVTVSRVPRAPLGASLLAALLYATYPELVQVERGPFIEPLLNLVCVSGALWVTSERRLAPLFAGVCFGLAVAVKILAAPWAVAAVVAMALRSRRDLGLVVLGGALGGLLGFAPVFVAPGAYLDQGFLFHLHRPPDGDIARLPRLLEIVTVRHLASPLLAAASLVILAVRRRFDSPLVPLATLAWLGTLTTLLSASAYWNQHNSHLIASEALLAGVALAAFPPRLRAVVMIATFVSIWTSANHSIRRLDHDQSHFTIARSPLATDPGCVYAFEPSWLIAANRLVPKETGPMIDSYATLLAEATKGGRRFENVSHAFYSVTMPPALASCRTLVLGDRGTWELNPDQLRLTHHPAGDGSSTWVR